jgi:DNA-cytosine methyltransferase
MKHASFFSGVGGLDLGFERAGIETVSVSEIDPYANAVLAERFPSAINLGSITEVNAHEIPEADIWSGGFPCQDLSVAGKRAGFAGRRSSLAFRFIDLMAERKPRWVVLENVPGLFTSNKGADFGRLLYEMERIGYGVSWRILNAQHFGIAQRRRRVFIVASLESDRAAQVLFECEGGCGHLEASESPWQNPATYASRGVAGSGNGIGEQPTGEAVDANRMRTVDGLAGRLDNRGELETLGADVHRTLQARDWKTGVNNQDIAALSRGEGFLVGYQTRVDETNGSFTLNEVEIANSLSALWPSDSSHRSMTLIQAPNETVLSFPSRFGANAQVTEGQAQSFAHSAGAPAVFRKAARAQTAEDSETWVEGEVANTLNGFDVGDTRTTHAILGGTEEPDDLLPIGLDSHRYRTCGNGVVAPVAEWIGRRIVEVHRRWQKEA